ncbi:unnamed protein product [Menidia menidia]|uniref:(Atlantic silverside) hypothetical protein n=1 Tax=Menidia menidia TaxID=238744 RepID=A0A8S4AX90_9TELE|nr:unnamed protein product [Menidia menidia]
MSFALCEHREVSVTRAVDELENQSLRWTVRVLDVQQRGQQRGLSIERNQQGTVDSSAEIRGSRGDFEQEAVFGTSSSANTTLEVTGLWLENFLRFDAAEAVRGQGPDTRTAGGMTIWMDRPKMIASIERGGFGISWGLETSPALIGQKAVYIEMNEIDINQSGVNNYFESPISIPAALSFAVDSQNARWASGAGAQITSHLGIAALTLATAAISPTSQMLENSELALTSIVATLGAALSSWDKRSLIPQTAAKWYFEAHERRAGDPRCRTTAIRFGEIPEGSCFTKLLLKLQIHQTGVKYAKHPEINTIYYQSSHRGDRMVRCISRTADLSTGGKKKGTKRETAGGGSQAAPHHLRSRCCLIGSLAGIPLSAQLHNTVRKSLWLKVLHNISTTRIHHSKKDIFKQTQVCNLNRVDGILGVHLRVPWNQYLEFLTSVLCTMVKRLDKAMTEHSTLTSRAVNALAQSKPLSLVNTRVPLINTGIRFLSLSRDLLQALHRQRTPLSPLLLSQIQLPSMMSRLLLLKGLQVSWAELEGFCCNARWCLTEPLNSFFTFFSDNAKISCSGVNWQGFKMDRKPLLESPDRSCSFQELKNHF